MPTSAQNTYSMKHLTPAMPRPVAETFPVYFAASQTIARGTVLGQLTSGGKFKAYDHTLSDGTQVAKAIAKDDIITDSSGNVHFGTSGSVEEQGQLYLYADVFITGVFNCADITCEGSAGITAAALGDLQGRLIAGSLTTGQMIF